MLQIQSYPRIVRQNSDGIKVKQRMKELKLMFGTLLETKREKVKRKKLELKNNAPVNQVSIRKKLNNKKIILRFTKKNKIAHFL